MTVFRSATLQNFVFAFQAEAKEFMGILHLIINTACALSASEDSSVLA